LPARGIPAAGQGPAGRCEAYRALFKAHLDDGLVERIREATNGNYALGDRWFQAEIEQALGNVCWKEGAGHKFYGPNNVPDLWHVKKVNPQSMIHLTEKPVELAVQAMQYSSHQGENVLDLFGGNGSTLIAAEQRGRKAFLMELDPLILGRNRAALREV
jgi:DNA methylase